MCPDGMGAHARSVDRVCHDRWRMRVPHKRMAQQRRGRRARVDVLDLPTNRNGTCASWRTASGREARTKQRAMNSLSSGDHS